MACRDLLIILTKGKKCCVFSFLSFFFFLVSMLCKISLSLAANGDKTGDFSDSTDLAASIIGDGVGYSKSGFCEFLNLDIIN